MSPLDAFLSAVEALRRHVLRTILTSLGLVVGTGAVIAMLAVGTGARERLAEQIRSLGANLIVVSPGSASASGVRQAAGSRQDLTTDDAAAIVREVPSVQVAAPVVRGPGQIVFGNLNWQTALVGADDTFLEAREWPLARGRGFTAEETAGAGKVIVVGRTVARELFGAEEPLGQTVRVQTTLLRVVGVLAPKGQNTQGADQDDVAIVPLTTAKTRLIGSVQASPRGVGAVVTKVREGHDMEAAEADIRTLLRQRHRRAPDQDDGFTIRNLTEVMAQRDAAARTLTLLLGTVAGVSLVVGGIGVMNVMLVSVTERTREIGLRMAVGARRRDIVAQFLIEAAAISIAGAAIGVAGGIGVAALLAGIAGWPTIITPTAVMLGAGCSLATGLFFGLYPSQRAARLDPVDALRHG